MRERNKEFLNDIGDLMKEIENQDMEHIEGGNVVKGQNTLTLLTVITIKEAQCNQSKNLLCQVINPISKGNLCICK